MAFRLKFSARALREIGEAQEWYELQNPGLGHWQEREYLDTDEFNEWVAAQKEAKRGNNIVALAG